MALTKVDISMLEDISAGTKVVAVTPSTSGNILTSDGTNWTSAVAAAGGKVVQVVSVQDGALATGTTVTQLDDTIPQKTEGNEFMTLAITPTSASNKLIIEVEFHVSYNVGNRDWMIALFQDSTANAVAVSTGAMVYQLQFQKASLMHYMTSGTTSSTTFKVRIGAQSAGTFVVNGYGGTPARKYGGKLSSMMTIMEIEV